MFLLFKLYEITGFHHGVIEIFTNLGGYLVYVSHRTNLHHTTTYKSEVVVYKLLTTTSEIQIEWKLVWTYSTISSAVWYEAPVIYLIM